MRIKARIKSGATLVAYSMAIALCLLYLVWPMATAANPYFVVNVAAKDSANEIRTTGDNLIRKVPGPSPQQTIDNFLALTSEADQEIRAAFKSGMNEPGWTFSKSVHDRIAQAADKLQQSTQALDLTQIAPALRPMTGVGRMLQLRSLLLYDLAHSIELKIPDEATTKKENIHYWALPNTPISLAIVNEDNIKNGKACQQCSAGDFLFSGESINQVPEDFQKLFDGKPALGRQYGADIYTFWARLPGGALPPKLFFELSKPIRRFLLTPTWGQSLLQWILLLPVTIAAFTLSIWWLIIFRRWRNLRKGRDDVKVYLISALFVLPLFLVLMLWQWYAIEWINLIGLNQEMVLIFARVFSGLLLALLTYMSSEALGQFVARTRQRHPNGRLMLVRRKGAGQIMTIARIAGILGVCVIMINVGRDLGLTSLTLLGLASVPALAISLGTKNLIHDIADGFSILLDGELKVGDRCTIGTPKSGEIQGKVLSLGMRSIRLELEDGSELSIPNSMVGASVVTNHRFRSSKPWNFSQTIEQNDPSAVLLLLRRARQVMHEVPELVDGQVELVPHETGWQLKISGRWRTDLSREILFDARQGFHLRLMQVIYEERCSEAQAAE